VDDCFSLKTYYLNVIFNATRFTRDRKTTKQIQKVSASKNVRDLYLYCLVNPFFLRLELHFFKITSMN
jgi:hypothetical protein